jgi:hypothetical protein
VSVGEKVVELRRWLREREAAVQRVGRVGLLTGLPEVDGELPSGLPWAAVTEVAAPCPSCGAQSLLVGLLRGARRVGVRAALVDAEDRFDVETAGDALEHVLWVRGTGRVAEALRAADLVVRDGNLPLVVLDLRGVPAREVRRQPPAAWYRLQRGVEETTVALVVFTSAPLVACAAVRVALGGSLPLEGEVDEPGWAVRVRAAVRWRGAVAVERRVG